MNNFNVITTSTFSDFVTEVAKGQVVRLCLGEKYAPEKYGTGHNVISVPAKRITLDVQGFNGEGDLIWLSRGITVRWSNDGPATPDDKDRHDGMSELRHIVLDALEEIGYQVRPGRYTLPNEYIPLNGYFDCAEWYKDEEGHVRVRPVDMPVPQTHVPAPVDRFQLDLNDGSNSDDAPSVPVEVEVDLNSIFIRVPATPDAVYSAAEVYVEHYEGQVIVRVWDQDTMRASSGEDPVAAVTLLPDSADRTMGANDD